MATPSTSTTSHPARQTFLGQSIHLPERYDQSHYSENKPFNYNDDGDDYLNSINIDPSPSPADNSSHYDLSYHIYNILSNDFVPRSSQWYRNNEHDAYYLHLHLIHHQIVLIILDILQNNQQSLHQVLILYRKSIWFSLEVINH
jgi:hypothetical protein